MYTLRLSSSRWSGNRFRLARNSPFTFEHDRFWNYRTAVYLVILSFVLKRMVEALLGPGPPLLFYLPAATVAAWLGGLGPGLTATLLGGIAGAFDLPPVQSLWLESLNDRFRMVVYGIEGLLVSGLMERLHLMRRRAEASSREAVRCQEELGNGERRMRAILDNSSPAICLKDRDGRYLLVNRRFELFTGKTVGPILGKRDRDLFPAELASRCESQDRLVLDYGKTVESEELLDQADGRHSFLTVKFPVRDAAGVVYAVGCVATDITERKKVQHQLAVSEQRFRTLCQFSPIGVYLTDQDGRTTYANPRCLEILGVASEHDLGEQWSSLIHADDRARVVGQLISSAQVGGEFSAEFRVNRKDGGLCWIHDCAAPLLSHDGDVIGHVGTVEDVTERKNAEQALRRERDFAEGLIATARALVLVLDARGRIVRANPFLGHTVSCPPIELQGMDWFAVFVPPADRNRARDNTLRFDASQRRDPIIYPIQAHNGETRRVEWANRPLQGPDGEAYYLAIGHDLTELENAQQRAVQSERLAAIGEMVAGLTHESRNALHRSQVCLEMLRFEIEDRPSVLDLISRLQSAQDDLHHVFEDVRDYAAPIVLNLEPCHLIDIWRSAWNQLESCRSGQATRLHELLDHVEPTLTADPFRLRQVFRNVLENALFAAGDPPHIEIFCTQARLNGRDAVLIAVRDNGPGLDAEQRRRILEPFFTTKTRGTGLGMAIAHRIVVAHQGRIAVGEAGPGAEILITLPQDPT